MLNGDLYPKGKMLFHIGFETEVEYVCHAGNGVHIVLAPPLDCLDDRVREVKAEELVDETVPESLGVRKVDDECLEWIRRNQIPLYQSWYRTIGRLEAQQYLPEGLDAEGGFLFYAVFRYEAMRLKSRMAPGSKTQQ